MSPTTPSPPKNIIVLGGSYGGLSTAHYLLRHVIPQLADEHSILLISAASHTMCRPASPRALISDDMFPQEKLFVGVAEQFGQYPKDSFTFIQGTVMDLDHTSRTVSIRTSNHDDIDKLYFAGLVIATGASTPSPLLGLNGDVGALRSNWTTFRQALPHARKIIIAGGGPTGVEVAGELGEYLNGRTSWFLSKLDNPKVSIVLVASGPHILPLLRAAIAAKAEKYLAQVGVTVMKNARVKGVLPDSVGVQDVAGKAVVTLDDGKTLETDLYIPAFGTTPNTKFMHRSLLAPDGRVNTNPATLRVDEAGPRIYAIGDVSSWARPAVHNVLSAVPVLCTNIKNDFLLLASKDKSPVAADRVFKEDTRGTQLVPIGRQKGVGAAMGWQLPSFLVWLIKGRDYWLWTTGDLWTGKHWANEA